MSIAIIEDDPNIRSLLKIILSELNLPIDEYDNGWKGLDALTQKKYSLLVLDLMLPGVNGIEICRKIRQANNQMLILSRNKDYSTMTILPCSTFPPFSIV